MVAQRAARSFPSRFLDGPPRLGDVTPERRDRASGFSSLPMMIFLSSALGNERAEQCQPTTASYRVPRSSTQKSVPIEFSQTWRTLTTACSGVVYGSPATAPYPPCVDVALRPDNHLLSDACPSPPLADPGVGEARLLRETHGGDPNPRPVVVFPPGGGGAGLRVVDDVQFKGRTWRCQPLVKL